MTSQLISQNSVIPTLAARMQMFRSLGGNCEFGFVQRYCGVEPSGLLRFAYTPIDALIRGILCKFDGFGATGDLCIEETESGAYYCRSDRYNVWWNTMQQVGSVAPELLLEREYGRANHLLNAFFSELDTGSYMLVRTEAQGETETDFERLATALNTHGASPLLRVKAVGADWKPEPVRRVGRNTFEGSVRRFAVEEAWAVDLEPWIRLCDSAYITQHNLSVDALGIEHAGQNPVVFNTRLRHHTGQPAHNSHTSFMKAVDPAVFDPALVYVFSAWVWIPNDCEATRIFAACGLRRLGWVDADLGVRECWQRIWAAGRFEAGEAPGTPVGLGMIGSETDSFWSCRSSCYEGVLPRVADPPRVRPYPAPARWITRWLDRRQDVG